MSNSRIRKHLKNIKIKSYIRDSWGILQEYGYNQNDVLNCSLGVNPYGSSDITKSQKKIDWDMVSAYPNPSYKRLKEAVTNYWSEISDLKNSEIFFGTGSMGILNILTKLFMEKGSKVLGYCPQFNEFENLSKIIGSIYKSLSLNENENFKFQADSFVELIDESYDLIYIDNPNNPTGQIIKLSDIEKIAKKAISYNIPLIVDEAYGDFMDKSNSTIALANKYSNIIILRSFSKGLGIANLRLGYVVLNKNLKKYYKMINIPPFVFPDIFNDIAIDILEDKEFLINSKKKIKENKDKFINSISKDYIIVATDMEVPILTIGTKKEVDFYKELLKVGILSAAGEDFTNLGKRYVRLRVPKDVNELIKRLDNIKDNL